MTIDTNILEKKFLAFSDFIKNQDGQPFNSFSDSKFIDSQENYKYSVYKEARENLGQKWWKPEDIGTGKIQNMVSSAIQARVNHNSEIVDNNLVDWRKKDDFSKLPKNKSLESLLFDFYKSKRKDNDCFADFISAGLSYQFIAYLFFLKNYQRFMPISQSRFDLIFDLLGVDGFKTSGKASWENYSTYIDLIKQTRDFLRTKDKNTTLLDAHTFLWILGQTQIEKKEDIIPEKATTIRVDPETESVEELKKKITNSTELSVAEWSEILLDRELTKETELSIFQELYTFQDHKAYAGQIARYLGTSLRPLNLDIKKYAQKIAINYKITFPESSENYYKFWFLFFNVWEEGTKNIWQLRSELKIALEQTNLTGISYGGELPPDIETEFFEGLRKIVIVNSFERNLMARKKCIKHWKAICSVCEFDFEKTYGEIGKGFIHVHHLIPISQIGETYKVDPISDLIPICPNCHSILHKKEPPFSIEEMKKMLEK